MASSSSFNKVVPLILCGVLVFQFSNCEVWAADAGVNPFPVLGAIHVPEGHWNEVPDLEYKLTDSITDDALRFQLLESAGEEYFSQTLLDESHKAFQKLIKAKKPSPSEYAQQMSAMRLAEIDLLQGRSDDALKAADALTKDSNPYISEESVFLVGRCYLAKRDWANMEKTVSGLLHQNPAYSEDLALNLMRSVAAIEQNHPDEALVYLKKYPNEPSALYYQGVCYIKKKEISNALPLYQQILQKDTHSEWVDRMRLSLGEAFYSGNDLTLATEFFKPVTRPQAEAALRPLALHRMACIFFQQKKFDDCDKILNDLLKQYPHHQLRTQWTYLYASIPIFNKDWRKAIQEQKMALEFERGLAPRVHGVDVGQLRQSMEFRILWAHLLLNDFNGGKILADKFIGTYPKEQITSYAYLAKGLALYRMGDYDRALEVYQQLLNNFPDSSACGKAVYLMTLCLHSARDPFRMAGILNEIHTRMAKASADSTKTVDEWTQNTLYWVADAYYQLNDLANAEKIYKEFILRAPQSPLVPYALEGLGSALSAQGPTRDGEALVALQQALLRSRDLNYKEFAEQIQLELAKIYYNQRDFAKASSSWDELVQSSTNTAIRSEALFRQGDALSHEDYYQEAIKRWQLLAHSFKDSVWVADALMRIGNTQAGLGDWPAATSTYTTLKNSYPNSEQGKEGAFQLVQCSFNAGNLPAAVGALLSFAKQYPDDARIPKAADNLLSSFRQKKVNISAADQAALLKLAPGSAGGASLLWERGAALFNEAKYEPAQKLFEKIMLSYPNDEYAPLAYFYDADCFFWLQKWDEAANAYQNFYVSFPKHERVPNAMFQRAVCLFRKGVYDDAVTGFKDFLHKFPDHPLAKEAWLNIALAHKKAFQLDQAVWAYKYVIQHYPSDPKINAVWVQMGSLYEVQGKLADAQQAYAKVSDATPESAEALYHRAMIFDQQHNSVDSVRLLEQVRAFPDKKNEFRQAALVKLSEIYEQQGAPAAKLRALYQDLAASTTDPEIAKQAQQRLQEIKWKKIAGLTFLLLLQGMLVWAAAPTATQNSGSQVTPDEMEVGIVGHYKGRLLVKKIVAPVTMNLEKLQDFPEDPSQKILYDPLPISQGGDFNARSDVKGHAPYYPWIPSIPEPPFLTMVPPKNAQPASWMFEVFNPQGQTIFRQRGVNAMPDQLIWEGKDSENKFAVVDRLYSAQLTLVGTDEKATVIQGESVVLPAMVYGSDQSETVEFSLGRLFSAGKADISPEGTVMLSRIAERIRERGLTQMHVRIQGADDGLSMMRETALVNALQKALLLSPGMIEHDHTKTIPRGEIAVFWLKRANS